MPEGTGRERLRHWKVIFEHFPSGPKCSEYFDAIFVCTGHYWSPRLPDIIHKFRNLRWMHSHAYRRAERFSGMRVAVIGARLSGLEIALQLSEHAEKVGGGEGLGLAMELFIMKIFSIFIKLFLSKYLYNILSSNTEN